LSVAYADSVCCLPIRFFASLDAASASKTVDENKRLTDIRPVLHKFGQLLMVVAVLSATGTHWLAFQSVAWTTMLAENLQTASWQSALQRTFDGKHPCCLCKEIAKNKQSEKKSDAQVELKKIDLSHTRFEFVFCAPAHFHEVRAANSTANSLTQSPSVPPPKEFLG
jgi:hypothetical protein